LRKDTNNFAHSSRKQKGRKKGRKEEKKGPKKEGSPSLDL
jgi:hypothetical protein